MAIKRSRPQTLPSVTTKLVTEFGNLYIVVSLDESGQPFEVFGFLGKAGSLQHGMAELACRLVALHLRRGTPIEEIVEQCQGICEMQPWPNVMADGNTVYVHGLGDAIALVLRGYLLEEAQPPELPAAWGFAQESAEASDAGAAQIAWGEFVSLEELQRDYGDLKSEPEVIASG